MSRNFSRLETFAPLIAGVTVFLLSFLSPQRSPIHDAGSSCWRTCAEEPLVASWKVIPVAAACGIAVAVTRYSLVPIFAMAAIGWLVYGMWAAVLVASYYAGFKFGRVAAVVFLGLSGLVIATVVFTSSGSGGGLWRGSVVYVATAIGMMLVLPFNVRNAAPGSIPEPIPGSGLGLAGLSERVTALGGTFSAGPTADGGFEIHAENTAVRRRGEGVLSVMTDALATAYGTDLAVTQILVVSEVNRSRAFWVDVLGAELFREYGGTSVVLRFGGSWLLLVTGGPPTVDKPDVTFAAPSDPTAVSHALTLRVADCFAVYQILRERGAVFLAPPHDWGGEIRCFTRDPDGHLIEFSQAGT